MNAEGKDRPEPGSIGEGLPPRVLDLVLKSGSALKTYKMMEKIIKEAGGA